MKRTLIFLISLIVVAFLSYRIESFEFLLIVIILLLLVFLILLGIISIFKTINPKRFKTPLLMLAVCLAGVLASLLRPYDEAILEDGNSFEKLKYAYETDQKDRMQLKSYILGELNPRDKKRLKQVKVICKQENDLIPIDKFHAAFVYHHSDNSKDYKMASQLATAAAEAPSLQEHYQVQWLRKAAYDRWMISIGKPEKFNTQGKFSVDLE